MRNTNKAKATLLNTTGPQVKKFRKRFKISQKKLAEKCQLVGWNISRDIIARIEAQKRHVNDSELIYLSRAFKITPSFLMDYQEECIKLCPFKSPEKTVLSK